MDNRILEGKISLISFLSRFSPIFKSYGRILLLDWPPGTLQEPSSFTKGLLYLWGGLSLVSCSSLNIFLVWCLLFIYQHGFNLPFHLPYGCSTVPNVYQFSHRCRCWEIRLLWYSVKKMGFSISICSQRYQPYCALYGGQGQVLCHRARVPWKELPTSLLKLRVSIWYK